MFLRIARWVPASGILFAALVVAATLVKDSPGGKASDAELLAYYADGGNRNAELVAVVLIGLAGFCFLAFLGSLRGVLARAEGEPARLTTTVVASGTAFIALALAGHALSTAVAASGRFFPDAFQVDPNTARLLAGTSFMFFAISLFGAAAMTLAASILALHTGVLPRWLGLGGLVATAGGLLGLLVWPSLLVLAWIVAVSGYLLRPARSPEEVPAALPAA